MSHTYTVEVCLSSGQSRDAILVPSHSLQVHYLECWVSTCVNLLTGHSICLAKHQLHTSHQVHCNKKLLIRLQWLLHSVDSGMAWTLTRHSVHPLLGGASSPKGRHHHQPPAKVAMSSVLPMVCPSSQLPPFTPRGDDAKAPSFPHCTFAASSFGNT